MTQKVIIAALVLIQLASSQVSPSKPDVAELLERAKLELSKANLLEEAKVAQEPIAENDKPNAEGSDQTDQRTRLFHPIGARPPIRTKSTFHDEAELTSNIGSELKPDTTVVGRDRSKPRANPSRPDVAEASGEGPLLRPVFGNKRRFKPRPTTSERPIVEGEKDEERSGIPSAPFPGGSRFERPRPPVAQVPEASFATTKAPEFSSKGRFPGVKRRLKPTTQSPANVGLEIPRSISGSSQRKRPTSPIFVQEISEDTTLSPLISPITQAAVVPILPTLVPLVAEETSTVTTVTTTTTTQTTTTHFEPLVEGRSTLVKVVNSDAEPSKLQNQLRRKFGRPFEVEDAVFTQETSRQNLVARARPNKAPQLFDVDEDYNDELTLVPEQAVRSSAANNRVELNFPRNFHVIRPTEAIKKLPRDEIKTIDRFTTNNDDGSITWGFQAEDGSFKEETSGVDCVTRGRYGYIDPEGQIREFAYTSGIPCDPLTKQPLTGVTPDSKDAAGAGSVKTGYFDYSDNKFVMPDGRRVTVVVNKDNRARG